MKTVKYCSDGFEAHVTKGMLENEGIAACVINENCNCVLPYGTAIREMSVQVTVSDDDFERASNLIEQMQKEQHPAPSESICPKCGSKEITFGFWGSKNLVTKIITAIMLIFSGLAARPIGNLRNHYYCKKCRHEFKQ